MKKYLNLFLLLSLVFVLSFGVFSFTEKVNAETDCVAGQVYDTATGTPCASIALDRCQNGVLYDSATGKPCPVKQNLTTNTGSAVLSNSTGFIKKGTNNKEIITAIQQALLELGFTIKVDGIFGKVTQEKIKAFQKSNGLRIDGVVGVGTFESLQKRLTQKGKSIELVKRIGEIKNNVVSSKGSNNSAFSGATSTSGSSTGTASGNGVVKNPNTTKPPVLKTGVKLSSESCSPGVPPIPSEEAELTITADNRYQAFIVDNDGNVVKHVVQDINWDKLPNSLTPPYSPAGPTNTKGWGGVEKAKFQLAANQHLCFAADDDDYIAQMIGWNINYKGKDYPSNVNSNWKRMWSKAQRPIHPNPFPDAELKTEITRANTNNEWLPLSKIGNYGVGPWLDKILYINKLVEWLSIDYGDGASNKNYTIICSQYPGEGAIDCVCPAGSTGTPPNCTPGTSDLDITVTESCRGNVVFWPTPAQEINSHVKFSEAVNVVGVPEMVIKKVDGTNGVVMKYVSGSGSDTLQFRYIVPSVLPPGFNYTKADFIGDYTFVLPLASGVSIKTVATGANVKLEGKWTAPDGPLCPTPDIINDGYTIADLAQITHMRKTTATSPLSAEVRFKTDKNVHVVGIPVIKLVNINTSTFGAVLEYNASASGPKELVFSRTDTTSDTFTADHYSFTNYPGLQFFMPAGSNIYTLGPDGTKYYPNALNLGGTYPTY